MSGSAQPPKPGQPVERAAPLVLILPDTNADAGADWRQTIAALAPRFRVALGPPLSLRSLEATVAAQAVADRLAQSEAAGATIYLCGHGLGGVVALAFAVRFGGRLRGLILVDTTPEPLSAEMLASMPDDAAQAEPPRSPPRTLSAGFLDRLEFITTPTLVVAGEADAPFWQRGAELLHGWIPFSRLVRIPDSAHAPQRENAAAFSAELLAYLEEMEAARVQDSAVDGGPA